jgi:hypothetical protein
MSGPNIRFVFAIGSTLPVHGSFQQALSKQNREVSGDLDYCFCSYHDLDRYASFLTLVTFGEGTFFFNSLIGMPALRDSCFIRLTCLRIPRDVFLIFPLLVFVTIMSTPYFVIRLLLT